MNSFKKQIQVMQSKGAKGGKGKAAASSGEGQAGADPAQGQAAVDNSKSNDKRLKDIRAKEVLRLKTDGPNGKPICHFYQRGRCLKASECAYPHICLRCHKPGHTVLECRVPPQYK